MILAKQLRQRYFSITNLAPRPLQTDEVSRLRIKSEGRSACAPAEPSKLSDSILVGCESRLMWLMWRSKVAGTPGFLKIDLLLYYYCHYSKVYGKACINFMKIWCMPRGQPGIHRRWAGLRRRLRPPRSFKKNSNWPRQPSVLKAPPFLLLLHVGYIFRIWPHNSANSIYNDTFANSQNHPFHLPSLTNTSAGGIKRRFLLGCLNMLLE